MEPNKALKSHNHNSSPERIVGGNTEKKWVDRELGEHVPMIVSTRKFEHCLPGQNPAILIDDRRIHCEAWQLAGGVAILHSEIKDTIRQLLEAITGQMQLSYRS